MKKYGFSIVTFIILSFLFFVYKDAQIILDKSIRNSYVEQQNTTTVGYENGLPVFTIDIQKLRQENYRHILIASNINNGTIYNADGDNIIQQLTGDYGRINTNIKSILVTGNINAIIRPVQTNRFINVISDQFHYNHNKREATFQNEITIGFDSISIQTENLVYQNKNEIILFNSKTSIENATSKTIINQAQLDVNKFKMKGKNGVESRYKKERSKEYTPQINELIKSKTIITSKKIDLDFENNEQVIATYNEKVKVNQDKKSISSEVLNLNFLTNIYTASGNVTFSFEDLTWLKNRDKEYKNVKIKSMVRKKTDLSANSAQFTKRGNQLKLNGNVTIRQLDFKLSCDSFVFDFNKDIITTSGNVIVEKFGIEHLNTSYLIIDIKNETFKTGSSTELSEITIEL